MQRHKEVVDARLCLSFHNAPNLPEPVRPAQQRLNTLMLPIGLLSQLRHTAMCSLF